MCETRWVARHDALIRFAELFDAVILTLQSIEQKANVSAVKTKANSLLSAICTLDFVVAMHSATKLLGFSQNLSRLLQDKQADLQKCYNLVKDVLLAYKSIQQNISEEFGEVFLKTVQVCEHNDIDIMLPRFRKRGVKGARKSPCSVDEIQAFYQTNLFQQFLHEFIRSFEARFENHNSSICVLLKLLPGNLQDITKEEVEELYNFYKSDINTPFENCKAEIALWKQKWSTVDPTLMPVTALDNLENCDSSCYPVIYRLFRILCTMPISVASAERSFSSLRRLKTYLRNTMKEDRLNGLALLTIHHDMLLDVEEVLLDFKRRHPRIVLP